MRKKEGKKRRGRDRRKEKERERKRQEKKRREKELASRVANFAQVCLSFLPFIPFYRSVEPILEFYRFLVSIPRVSSLSLSLHELNLLTTSSSSNPLSLSVFCSISSTALKQQLLNTDLFSSFVIFSCHKNFSSPFSFSLLSLVWVTSLYYKQIQFVTICDSIRQHFSPSSNWFKPGNIFIQYFDTNQIPSESFICYNSFPF